MAVQGLNIEETGNNQLTKGVFLSEGREFTLSVWEFINILQLVHSSATWQNKVTAYFQIKQLYMFAQYNGGCHHHGCFTRLPLDSFFISLSPTLHNHSLILSFSLILSIHMTLILSYPSLHTHYLTFLIFPSNALVIVMTSFRTRGTAIYLYSRGWSSSANSKAI